jgi:pectinesterase
MKFLVISWIMVLIISTAFAQDKLTMVVAMDGSGDFVSIQKAIDASKAFPDKRVTIFVRNGIYREKLVVPSCNARLSLVGESPEKTVVTFDDYFDKINRGRNSTFFTYTLLVQANDFRMENITVENTAGPVGQAVALHVEGDRSVIVNCRILGNQDTLYAAGRFSRQYFLNCTVEGTTDFIFGEATVLFESCTIVCKSDSYLTAASTPEGKPFGFVFVNCRITGLENVKKVYLGRPWRNFAKVAYLNCEMGSFICKEGWHNWSKPDSEKSAFFGEYGNTGAGAETAGRVPWAHQLSREEASEYMKENIFAPIGWEVPSGEEWYNYISN